MRKPGKKANLRTIVASCLGSRNVLVASRRALGTVPEGKVTSRCTLHGGSGTR